MGQLLRWPTHKTSLIHTNYGQYAAFIGTTTFAVEIKAWLIGTV